MLGLPPAVLCVEMVLPVRIELTTSALPRMRSTTELRQHLASGARRRYGRGHGRMSRRAMAKRDEEREKRLAEALRENLRRRKAQARGDGPRHPGESRDLGRWRERQDKSRARSRLSSG